MKSCLDCTKKLNENTTIPLIGTGTYSLGNMPESMINMFKLGYRLVDTASFYKNEEAVGNAINKAIQEGIVERKDLFIITKMWNDEQENPKEAIERSLKRLNLDYVDLYLVHWPIGKVDEKGVLVKSTPMHIIWKNMENLVDLGLTKNIGVSNFNVQLLMDILSYSRIPPLCNEIEMHPFLSQEGLANFCKKFNVHIISYWPVMQNNKVLVENDLLNSLALKYNRSISDIVLNWHLHRGFTYLIKTATPTHQESNFKTNDFVMTDEEYSSITKLNQNLRLNTPERMDFLTGGIPVFE